MNETLAVVGGGAIAMAAADASPTDRLSRSARLSAPADSPCGLPATASQCTAAGIQCPGAGQPRTAGILGAATIGDLGRIDARVFSAALGPGWAWLAVAARGEDDDPVTPPAAQKSVGREVTKAATLAIIAGAAVTVLGLVVLALVKD